MNDTTPYGLFVFAFLAAACAGVAALLRGGTKLTVTAVLSAALNGGILGLGLSLLWFMKFRENLYFLLGIVILAGLGGVQTVDLVVDLVRRLLGGKSAIEEK